MFSIVLRLEALLPVSAPRFRGAWLRQTARGHRPTALDRWTQWSGRHQARRVPCATIAEGGAVVVEPWARPHAHSLLKGNFRFMFTHKKKRRRDHVISCHIISYHFVSSFYMMLIHFYSCLFIFEDVERLRSSPNCGARALHRDGQ